MYRSLIRESFVAEFGTNGGSSGGISCEELEVTELGEYGTEA